jgi:hypothetical protein
VKVLEIRVEVVAPVAGAPRLLPKVCLVRGAIMLLIPVVAKMITVAAMLYLTQSDRAAAKEIVGIA